MSVTDRFNRGIAAIALTAATMIAAPAMAQDRPAADDMARDTVTVGAGGAYLSDYEGSSHYRWKPAPVAIGSIKGYSFMLLGNRFSADLIRNEPGPVWDIQAGPVDAANLGRSDVADLRVRALGNRKTAIELGGYVGLGKTGVITSDYDTLSVSLSYRHDISGVHKSGIITPSISYITPLSRKAAVGLFASADHVQRGYGQAYFDVDAAGAAASGLPVFTARGGWKNYTIGGGGGYSLTGDLLHGWKLAAGGSYSRMLGDYGDSPLVSIAGSRGQWLGVVGVAYTF